jgi:DNA-binding LacI/PurR family transcriptional regulator
VTVYRPDLAGAQGAAWAFAMALQGVCADREWSLLAAHAGGREHADVLRQLKAGNVRGAILDTIDEELRVAVMGAGLPVVMVNSWVEGLPVDAVLQDNYAGGFAAAEHLMAQGIERIGWAGHISEFCHSRERFAGAAAALSMKGLRIDESDCLALTEGKAREQARAFLSRDDRPEALLSFAGIHAVCKAAGELGLRVGRDLLLVGWTVEECYAAYRGRFGGGEVPPAVVWSAREMADRALKLLAERGEGVRRRPVRACIGTELRLAEAASSNL